MAKQDRLSIDLKGLREKIEAYSSDPMWNELSMGAKVRALVETALQRRDATVSAELSKIVCDYWEAVIAAGLDISGKRLKEIRGGARPSDSELIELGTVLPLDTHQLTEIRDRQFGRGNGQPATERV